MGKYRVGYLVFLLIATVLVAPGCFRGGSGNNLQQTPPVAAEALTNVRLVIGGEAANQAIRAQTALPPQVYFELRLLDRSNSSMPIIRFRKQAQVVSSESGYTASALFENIPVMPAIASMSINGGYLPGVGDQPFKIWVGKKDLVAAAENEITLVGSGDKSATDVSINLLERLIAAPANVATLAIPIFTRVDEIVAGLNLSSVNVYEEAYSAYNAAYAPLPVPADAEFQPPAGYASIAYPKKDSSLNLTIPAFGSASESWVLLMNRSTDNATPSWSVANSGAGAMRASVDKATGFTNYGKPLTSEQIFDLNLRRRRPDFNFMGSDSQLRSSMRSAVLEGSAATFKHITNPVSMTFADINAKCKAITSHANGRLTYFFLDDQDENLANISLVINGLAAKWSNSNGIYEKNRLIFGEEPPGIFTSNDLNAVDESASATYVLVSSQIFTAGYFFSGDLFPQDNSNRKKIFFLKLSGETSSSNGFNRVINSLSATAAHEFQHMIHFWQKRHFDYQAYLDNEWLDEAMSGYAEHINGFSINGFLNQSKAIQVENYLAALERVPVNRWITDADGSAFYGKAYLFGTWLAQNYGINDSVKGLLENGQAGDTAIDYFNGEETVAKTYAKFLLTLAVDAENGGIYGFKDFNVNGIYSFDYGLADVTLTGPARTEVNAVTGGSGAPPVAPYCAAYIRITAGNGGNVNLGATLPSSFALFELHR